jgi:hypothetical protein
VFVDVIRALGDENAAPARALHGHRRGRGSCAEGTDTTAEFSDGDAAELERDRGEEFVVAPAPRGVNEEGV